MKAGINTRYGGPEVVEVRDTPKPVPKATELLVRVRATTVNRTDCYVETGQKVGNVVIDVTSSE